MAGAKRWMELSRALLTTFFLHVRGLQDEGKLYLPSDYDKYLHPNFEKGVPTDVYFRMQVHQINTNERNEELSFRTTVTMTWKEPRLDFRNSTMQSVDLQTDDQKHFWRAQLYIMELVSLQRKKVLEDSVFMRITADKRVYYILGVEIVTSCNFDFALYPLDIQHCHLSIFIPREKFENIQMHWFSRAPLEFGFDSGRKETKLPQHTVILCGIPTPQVLNRSFGKFSMLSVRVILRREIKSHILGVYLPSTIFVFVSWGSFVVPADAIPGRMVLLVTTLLALITVLEGVRSQSPPSVAVKSVEVWLLTCIVFVFAALLEFLVILFERNRNAASKRVVMCGVMNGLPRTRGNGAFGAQQSKHCYGTTRRLVTRICLRRRCYRYFSGQRDNVAIVVFPLSFALFSIGYWLLYLTLRRTATMQESCL